MSDSEPDVVKFGYDNFQVHHNDKTSSAKCKTCKAIIKEKLGTTSAFVRHLSVQTHPHLRQA